MLNRAYFCAILLLATPLWSQVANPGSAPTTTTPTTEDRMITSPVVSGEAYSVALGSEERSNYLRGGVAFTSAYSDNTIGATTGSPVSDVSYSIWPTIALDKTTPRLHSILAYSPGFTFYQRSSALNQADQNASIDFHYRLSPHVTFSARDSFQKSSNVFNQPSAAVVSGGVQEANSSVIAPIADRLSNSGNVGIAYQFARNGMVGAGGTFTNLHYPNPSQVPGLFDSSTQGGSGFYSYRVSRMHYIGAAYQYQRLMSYLTQGQNETQTHAVLFFYTLYPSPRFSISMFGGPQYADIGPLFAIGMPIPQPGSRSWTPAAGASMNWQGQLTTLAASYSHAISGGGGLLGAVQMDNAGVSIGRQIARALSASLSGQYAQNRVLGSLPGATTASSDGHSVSGTASLHRQFGEHLSVQLGYTRLHQTYNVPIIAGAPTTNREFVSFSYTFARPLGR